MIWTERFIKTFISLTFTIIVLANIIFAFNLVSNLPVDVGQSSSIDYSDYYFSFSNMYDSFQLFFGQNQYIQGFNNFLTEIRSMMSKISIERIFEVFDSTGLQFDVAYGDFATILRSIVSILNILINIPYIIFAIVYFFFYFVYVISLAAIFLTYVLNLIGGRWKTLMPSVTYPTPFVPNPDLPYPWLNSIIL